MEYKRSESFRHILIKPVDVQYSCNVDQQVALTRTGKMLDISPSGMSLLVTKQLTDEEKEYPLLLSFCLYKQTIESQGVIRWERLHPEGYQYGIEMVESTQLENMIVSELKQRRRQEVLDAKKGTF